MTEYLPTEKGVPIRMPSTANLMLDSADRNTTIFSSAWDFQINKPNSIMNGFFTRIGTTEVVLEWCENNIDASGGRSAFVMDISGVSPTGVSLASGIYTMEQAVNAMVKRINDLSGTTGTIASFNQTSGNEYLLFSKPVRLIDAAVPVSDGILHRMDLNAVLPDVSGRSQVWEFSCPDLRPYRYIDIVSPTLTYNQDLKDNATTPTARDVLCRWYFDEDQLPNLDAYGFPILMGYTRFCYRRIFNPPKQIKWSANQPIGYLAFQVYDDNGDLLPPSEEKTQWLMTLQLSEV